MNKQRKQKIKNNLEALRLTAAALDEIKDEEEEIKDNIISADKKEESEEFIDALSDSIDSINNAVEVLEDLI